MIQTINQTKKKDYGFTVVELLVVIVVIGILASITIVSYTSVTTKTKTTQAATNAAAAGTIADAISSDSGSYPATAASITSGSTYAKLPNGVTVVPQSTALNSGNGQTTVTWACHGASCTNTDGGRITYFDYSTGTVSTTIIYTGNAKFGDTFTNPAT